MVIKTTEKLSHQTTDDEQENVISYTTPLSLLSKWSYDKVDEIHTFSF